MSDKAYGQELGTLQQEMLLVHDYLDVNRAILEAIIQKQLYKDERRIARDHFVLGAAGSVSNKRI